MMDTSLARRIAEDLFDIRAVSFSPDRPFTWASGLRSPVYCDNRLTLSFPDIRRRIRDGFIDLVNDLRSRPSVVVGTATAGIPHAAWLADALDLPMAYVRSAPKAHGRSSQIEGVVRDGDLTVVIEDLVSTGGSSRTVVEALRAAGAEVLTVLAIFSYDLPEAVDTFGRLKIPLQTLTSFDEMFAVARRRGRLSEDEIRSIEDWRLDPQQWSKRHG